VPELQKPRLGPVLAAPTIAIGALATILIWEIEHVGSIAIAVAIGAVAVLLTWLVIRRVRRQIDEFSESYEGLLRATDTASRRAEMANQLKDEFLATLSHELRTPLNSVLGWARLLSTGKLSADQTAKALQAIERAGWTQSRLIENLLDTSRIVGGKLRMTVRPTMLQPLVQAAVQSNQPAADGKQIKLDVHLDPAIGPTTVDPDRFQQIVWNLVSNAVKFTPSGGEITVRLSVQDDVAVLTVDDTGIGFDPDVAAHLFERFRQGDSSTTREYGGLGLGLGIVRHLVELHGGRVTASSAGTNLGATFTVRIPLRAAPVPAVVGPIIPTSPFLRGVTVLVVDDDPLALEFVRETLQQYGAVVATAGSASEARERFEREPPDVLLSDLVMPGEDGVQLIREIRAMEATGGRRTPAAALTALARSEDRRKALNAGFQMHVAKPIDPEELAATVGRLASRTESSSHEQTTN
jgi:signal transduction histidine kinase/ActR/RegA family two-component response regulator